MEYYSAIKKNEIMLFAGKWMQMAIIVLSKFRLRKINITFFLAYVKSKFYKSSESRRGIA
jgi:hypothetical protein